MQLRPSVFPVAAFAVSILLVGCAPGKKDSESWQQDKQQVMQSIAQLQDNQEQLDESLKLVQKQLAEHATEKKQQDAAYAALHEQVAQLKAQIRSLRSAAARLNASRKITKKNLDKKIEKIAQAIKPAEVVEQTGSVEDVKDHYTAAYLALKSGRYEEAIEKFRDLLKTHPKNNYSDQAYYWLGESYLAQNNVPRAVGNLEWMVANYPDSTKHAAAMLRLGMAYQMQERPSEARDILSRLIDTHAESAAAQEARKLLQPTTAPLTK